MELIINKFSMNKGAMTWFGIFGVIVWNLLNHFFIEFFEKARLKITLEFGGIFGIIGKPSPSLI
jgi:hypothetical protein